jgi:predicted metal-dependent phosphoesterase TrpH
MAERLCDAGLAPDRTELDARLADGLPLGRPHLAAAAVRAHQARLQPAGLAEPSAFLEAYLVPGCPAYCRRDTPTVGEAIAAIHDAGGVAVWAHPFWDLWRPAEVREALTRFTAAGLDGVEAFYASHNREQTLLVAGIAAELGLLTTGSADFHGPAHRHFSRFRAFELHGLQPRLGPIAAAAPPPTG